MLRVTPLVFVLVGCPSWGSAWQQQRLHAHTHVHTDSISLERGAEPPDMSTPAHIHLPLCTKPFPEP
jgi:hypothetical protein